MIGWALAGGALGFAMVVGIGWMATYTHSSARVGLAVAGATLVGTAIIYGAVYGIAYLILRGI